MGRQLGSTLLVALVLYSSIAKISLPKICGFWGVRAGTNNRGALQVGRCARWEKAIYATCLFKKMGFDNENVLWLDLRSQMKP